MGSLVLRGTAARRLPGGSALLALELLHYGFALAAGRGAGVVCLARPSRPWTGTAGDRLCRRGTVDRQCGDVTARSDGLGPVQLDPDLRRDRALYRAAVGGAARRRPGPAACVV